ncbi:MAG: hypothetical protein HYX32_02510 [Actinobacteria bacterium]|nr:hypothetical protein [Actinomycetota bacterium]
MVAVTACSNAGKSAGSTLPPPPTAPGGQGAAGGAAPPGKATPECQASDGWGVVLFNAGPNVASDKKAELSAALDAKATAFKALVPAQAANIDARTTYAKALIAGAATDAEKSASEQATEPLNVWYASACKT